MEPVLLPFLSCFPFFILLSGFIYLDCGGFGLQRHKEAEAEFSKRLQELQAELASRDELQRKLETKVLPCVEAFFTSLSVGIFLLVFMTSTRLFASESIVVGALQPTNETLKFNPLECFSNMTYLIMIFMPSS